MNGMIGGKTLVDVEYAEEDGLDHGSYCGQD